MRLLIINHMTMGVIKHFSSSSHDEPRRHGMIHFSSSVHDNKVVVEEAGRTVIKVTSSPDPSKFEIVQQEVVGDWLILKVNYVESENYEGDKILVYGETDINKILETNGNILDPHFTENPNVFSPIARFEPTAIGWMAAQVFCEAMSK